MALPVVMTSGLSRRFGDLTAVESLDLEVPGGVVYGFLGPNGAGKTTTIRLLLGLLRPHAGEVRLFGERLPANREAVLRRVGAFVESPSFYSHLTGRENLEITRRLRDLPRTEVDRVLEQVDLSHPADRPVSGYSLGMRQRLGVGMALLGEPELILLDEPTNGLDPAGILAMRNLICELGACGRVTVLVSSHLLSEVEQVASIVGIVKQGRLCFQGSLAELGTGATGQVSVLVDRPAEAVEFLSASGWCAVVGPHQELLVDAGDAARIATLNRALVERGFGVHGLSAGSRSLEEIFLQLTATDRKASC